MLDQFSPHELQQLVDVANVGQWSWNLDSDEIRWSSQLGDIFGLEPDDYPDNIAELSALVPPSYGEDLRARFLESVDQESGCFEFDHPFIRGDGSDGWVRNRGRVEFCDQNQPRKLAAIVFDITTQKEIELSLQTREEQFRRFSELTSDYIFDADLTKLPVVPCVVAGSYERVVGYSEEELANEGGWTGIMHPEDAAAGMEVLEQLKAGNPTIHEYRIRNKFGETRWLRDHSRPILEDGKLVRVVGGVKDITDTKALQLRLMQAQKHEVMASMVGAVAHEFNNLLCVVSASTELLSLDVPDVSKEELQADIVTACDRASELTQSLLAFTHNLPNSQVLQLSVAIRDTIGILQRAAGKQVKVHVECAGDVKDTVAIDPGHLQLVLLNLATNARIAMREQGELTV